jgi:hypothetical protein
VCSEAADYGTGAFGLAPVHRLAGP